MARMRRSAILRPILLWRHHGERFNTTRTHRRLDRAQAFGYCRRGSWRVFRVHLQHLALMTDVMAPGSIGRHEVIVREEL